MKKIFAQTLMGVVGILLGLSLIVRAQLSSNTVKYQITYDASTQTYTAWVIPDYSVPNANNSGTTEKGGTAQYTIVVPKDFTITQITDIKGVWTKPTESDFRKLGPGNAGQTWPASLDASLNYYVIGKSPGETDYGTFTSGTPVALFSFKGNGCYGPIKPLPAGDAFIGIANTSYSLNVANSFYSRSGQGAGGNVVPLEQFVNISGLAADCTPLAANPDVSTTTVGTSVKTPVLQNDTKGGQPVTTSTVTITIDTPPSHGSVTPNTDGTITYTPTGTFTGTDCYVYKICDKTNTTLCDTARVCVTVSAKRVIYAYDDNGVTMKNTPVSGNVLINDDKATGVTPLTVATTLVQQPSHGTVTLTSAGNYTYTPTNNYTGTDSFKYRVCDSGTPSVCDTATVFITVRDPQATNNPPVALGDNAATKSGVPVSGNVLTNDSDPDPGQTLTASLVSNPSNGTVTFNPNGTYTYTPNAGFIGTDQFVYKACDNGTPQLCANATVSINVYGSEFSNLPPVANADLFTRTPSGPATGNVLTNDKDPEGGVLTINTTPVVGPSNGTVVINSDGTFTYTPNSGYTGPDQFVYEVCDNFTPKACSQAVVFIIPKLVAKGTADLQIKKTVIGASDKIIQLNGNVTYQIVVKNLGPDLATNVVVKDSVDAGLQLLTGVPTKGTFSSPLWTIPSLASGDSAVLTVTAKAVQEGIRFNYARIVSSDQNDPVKTNNETDVCVTVPIKLCVNQSVEATVPSTYTNVIWYKNGQQVATGNVVMFSEIGRYTFTASNSTCPASGCCPLVIESGTNCCPANLCIPVTVKKTKK